MDGALQEEFTQTLFRMRKIPMFFPHNMEAHPGELIILKKIASQTAHGKKIIFMSDIQDDLHFSKPAISQILNSLEKKHCIIRRIDTADRRKISVSVTDEGLKTMAETKAIVDRMVGAVAERFGETDCREFIRLMKKLFDVLGEIKITK